MHFQAIEELYQVSWRPTPVDAVPQFGQTIPVAPLSPVRGVKDSGDDSEKPAPGQKPAGAYRPPGARGLATPSIFKREDEGGAVRMPTNGTSTPPRGPYNRSPAQGANGYGPQNGGRRHVPGAAPQHTGSSAPDEREKKNKKKKDKKKEAAKDREQKRGPPMERVPPFQLLNLPLSILPRISRIYWEVMRALCHPRLVETLLWIRWPRKSGI